MNLIARMGKNPIVHTLITLKGNERACLWLEPLWGIPYNLYLPYVSVYMYAMGMDALKIGVVTTVFFASQMFWALLSGVLTDKLGRRLCTLIFDVLSWSVPSLLWMCAQNYSWFLVAALFNGMWRVTENSWGLLLVEEAPSEKLVHMYAISHIAGLVAGFVAPLAHHFVQVYGVVPTMRALYALTFVMMTAKFVILYFLSHETAIGKRRMEEYRGTSLWAHLIDSRHVFTAMVRNRKVMLTVLLIACFSAMKSVGDTFWPLLVTRRLGIAEENLSVFSAIRAILMLGCYFWLVPHVTIRNVRAPLLASFALLAGVQLLMIFMPDGAYALVILTVVMEAFALSMLNPVTSALQIDNLEAEERARTLGIFYALSMLVTAPFGAVAGWLAQMDWTLPFVLNLVFVALAVWTSINLWRAMRDGKASAIGN